MYKQAIVVRKDIRMGKGKLAAQVAHASLQAFLISDEKTRNEWLSEGAKKVVLKVSSLKTLLNLYEKAKKLKLPVVIIRDAGKTQVNKGTITCIGIGPEREDKIDKITGKLKLL
ncbi:MAG: peptidyl-tRNA hydrolase [Candidatus Aenigmarchaeota archaeon]|nr:peptidyl-tRNA hydrolase [Candidatus Aenigmarchaeota archaeon]